MTKAELISAIAEETKHTKNDVDTIVGSLLDNVTKALQQGHEVRLVGFGTFRVNHRAARTAKNPKTGAPIQVAASKVPVFKPGQPLKDSVNGGAD